MRRFIILLPKLKHCWVVMLFDSVKFLVTPKAAAKAKQINPTASAQVEVTRQWTVVWDAIRTGSIKNQKHPNNITATMVIVLMPSFV